MDLGTAPGMPEKAPALVCISSAFRCQPPASGGQRPIYRVSQSPPLDSNLNSKCKGRVRLGIAVSGHWESKCVKFCGRDGGDDIMGTSTSAAQAEGHG